MLIQTRDLTPRVLCYKSRDMQLLLKWLDLVCNSINLDIYYFTNLINPSKVPSPWLPTIGSLVGYNYDSTLTTDQNRFIIMNYKSLLRLRGSQAGIEYVVAMYLKLIGRNDTNFRVTVPGSDEGGLVPGYIYIDDENLDLSTVPLLTKMLEWVRPIGSQYVLRKSGVTSYESGVGLLNNVATYEFNYPIAEVLTTPGSSETEEIDRSVAISGSSNYEKVTPIPTTRDAYNGYYILSNGIYVLVTSTTEDITPGVTEVYKLMVSTINLAKDLNTDYGTVYNDNILGHSVVDDNAIWAYIIPRSVEFSEGWLSLIDGDTTPLSPDVTKEYKVRSSGNYLNKVYIWDGDKYSLRR